MTSTNSKNMDKTFRMALHEIREKNSEYGNKAKHSLGLFRNSRLTRLWSYYGAKIMCRSAMGKTSGR